MYLACFVSWLKYGDLVISKNGHIYGTMFGAYYWPGANGPGLLELDYDF